MFNAIGPILIFYFCLCHNIANANECIKYLKQLNSTSSSILNTTTLILPEPQFITPEKLTNQVVSLIKTDSQSILYKSIKVVKVDYNQANDQISFVVEYVVNTPLSNLEIILTKKGYFEFDDLGQINGFRLDPLFELQLPGELSLDDNNNYNIWLSEYLQKTNFWNTKNKYLFSEARQIFATKEALTELPALLTNTSAIALVRSLEASIWQTLNVDLRKRFELIEINHFDSGEYGQGSFDIAISLDDELIKHTGYRIISRVSIFKNTFKMSVLKDNFDSLDQSLIEPIVIQRILEYRRLFLTTNPFKKYKFEVQ